MRPVVSQREAARSLNWEISEVERDWGWAPEYIEAMWRMLQQDEPEDFVIATGETHKLADFVCEAFDAVGLNWQDHVRTSETLFRPTDILTVRADPSKAEQKLGWKARYRMRDVARMMVEEELKRFQS